MKRDIQAGFSMIEIMITIVIMGIIAAVAIPGYTKYVDWQYRRAAEQLLREACMLQREHALEHNGIYAKDFFEFSPATPHPLQGTLYPLEWAPSVDGHDFTVPLTGKKFQAQVKRRDTTRALTIDETCTINYAAWP